MITLIYHTELSNKEKELEWLRQQKIYPACDDYYDWIKNKTYARFGVIVSSSQALLIKLRHKLDTQETYKQR